MFPVHSRTRRSLERFAIDLGSGVILLGPQSYMSFLHLWKDAVVELTDSGGLQEETTAHGIPCITLRDNTERTITVSDGSTVLAGADTRRITEAAGKVMSGLKKEGGARRCGMATRRKELSECWRANTRSKAAPVSVFVHRGTRTGKERKCHHCRRRYHP